MMGTVYGTLLFVLVTLLAKPKQVACDPPTVWTFQDHGEALIGWNEAFLSGNLSSGPATLIHFDSHADMDLPYKWFDIQSQSSIGLSEHVRIDDFIPIAVLAGLVDRVVWVMPEWGTELDYGSYKYVVAEDREIELFQTDSDFSNYPILADTEDVIELDNVHWYSVNVIPVTKQALESLNLEETGPWILDIDLDVFSTENEGGKVLRENLELDFGSVQQFHECMCEDEKNCESENLLGEMAPNEISKLLLNNLTQDEMEDLMEDVCRAPIHYSSDEEVDAAVNLLFDWVETLVATPPGVITISESTNGFLPEEQLSRVKSVAPRLAELFGSDSPPKWIECSACVDLTVHNDLEIDVKLFREEDDNFELLLTSGEHTTLQSRVGEEFELFFTDEEDYRKFVFSVEQGKKRQHVAVSQLGSDMQCSATNIKSAKLSNRLHSQKP